MAKSYKDINWDLFELYCKAGSSQTKIAEALGITRDTLRKKAEAKYKSEYSAIYARLHSEGDLLLEGAMFQKAMKSTSPGNTQMLMWLSKVRLGYREPDNAPILSPIQDTIDKDHRIMALENELSNLRAQIANQSQAK